jgi:hypothetical protein
VADRRLTIAIFVFCVVLAFTWGLYYLVASEVGYGLSLSPMLIDFSAVTAVVVVVFLGLTLFVRMGPAASQREASGPVSDRRFIRLVIATSIAIVGLWGTFLVTGSFLGFGVGILFAPLFLTALLAAGDAYIWFEIFRKT